MMSAWLLMSREWTKIIKLHDNTLRQRLIWYAYFEVVNRQGDPEAANEAAWHWINGVGCKRNKKQAAKYYRYASRRCINF
jgi:TPR repeat protein